LKGLGEKNVEREKGTYFSSSLFLVSNPTNCGIDLKVKESGEWNEHIPIAEILFFDRQHRFQCSTERGGLRKGEIGKRR